MPTPEGTLISYATQPGNVEQDSADGGSPYTKKHLPRRCARPVAYTPALPTADSGKMAT